MDDFKRARPEPEACRHCMPKFLKPKASRIARARLKRNLPDAARALSDMYDDAQFDAQCGDSDCEWCR